MAASLAICLGFLPDTAEPSARPIAAPVLPPKISPIAVPIVLPYFLKKPFRTLPYLMHKKYHCSLLTPFIFSKVLNPPNPNIPMSIVLSWLKSKSGNITCS